MTFIYETTSGTDLVFNQEAWRAFQSDANHLQLDGFILNGTLIRRDVLDKTAVLGKDSEPHSEMKMVGGKLETATSPDDVAAGALSFGATKANKLCTVVDKIESVNRAGNASLPAGVDLVIGAGGRVVESQAADVSLMSSVVSLANGDFVNNLTTSGKYIKLKSSADNATARGVMVTLHGVGENNEYLKEVVTLSTLDSSVPKMTTQKFKFLSAWSVNQSLVGVDLQIKNDADVNISVVTAPVAGTTYGSVLTDDSDDTLGHSIQIIATTAPVADSYLIVKGTDDKDVEQMELIKTVTATTTYRTTKQFKTITELLVGADGVATNTYSMKVTANLVGQTIGTSPAYVVQPNRLFKMTRV